MNSLITPFASASKRSTTLDMPLPEFEVTVKERIIIYSLPSFNSKYRRIKLNFDNPLVQKAANRLGIVFDDCILKKKPSSFEPEIDQRRYLLHKKKVNDSIELLYQEYIKIYREEEKAKQRKANNHDIFSTKLKEFDSIEEIKKYSIQNEMKVYKNMRSPNAFPNILNKLESEIEKIDTLNLKSQSQLSNFINRNELKSIIHNKYYNKQKQIQEKAKEANEQLKIKKEKKQLEINSVINMSKQLLENKSRPSVEKIEEAHKKSSLIKEVEDEMKQRSDKYKIIHAEFEQSLNKKNMENKKEEVEYKTLKENLTKIEAKIKKLNKIKQKNLDSISKNARINNEIIFLKKNIANKQSDDKVVKIQKEFMSSVNKLQEAKKKKDQVIKEKVQNTKKMYESYFSKIYEKKKMKICDSQKDFEKSYYNNNNFSIENRSNSYEENKIISPQSSKQRVSSNRNKNMDIMNKHKLNLDMNRRQMNFIICKEAQEYNMAKLSRIKNLRKKQILEKFTNLKMKLENKKKEDEIYNSNLRKKEFELLSNNKISMHKTAKQAIQKKVFQDQLTVLKDLKDLKKKNSKNRNLLYLSSTNNLE